MPPSIPRRQSAEQIIADDILILKSYIHIETVQMAELQQKLDANRKLLKAKLREQKQNRKKGSK